jgi:hypothetical protein
VALAIFIMVGAIAVILLRRSKRKRHDLMLATQDGGTFANDKPEIDGTPVKTSPRSTSDYYAAELPTSLAHPEMESGKGGNHRPQELGA